MHGPPKRTWTERHRPALAAVAITVLYLVFLYIAVRVFDSRGQQWLIKKDGSSRVFTIAWLVGTPEYHWPILWHGLLSRLPGAVIVMAAAGALGLLMAREVSSFRKSRLGIFKLYLALLLLGIAFQAGPAAVHRMGALELPLRVYLPDHTSYFTDATKVGDLDAWLRDFPAAVRDHRRLVEMATHTRTHPPGAVALFYGANSLARRLPGLSASYADAVPRSEEARRGFNIGDAELFGGAAMALLLFLAAAAAAPLTYAAARRMAEEEEAILAAVFFAASPAFAHKTPMLDYALASAMLLALWLTLTAASRESMWRLFPAGAIVGAGLWLGTSMLAAFPLLAAATAASFLVNRKEEATAKRFVLLFLFFMAIVAITAAGALFIAGAFLGVGFPAVYSAITEVGWNFNNQTSGRFGVLMWTMWNHYEMLAWAGVPLSFFFVRSVYREARKVRRKGDGGPDPWVAAIVVFMVALNFSGRVCYEASRLAWFCFPLMAIVAAKSMPFNKDKPFHEAAAILLAAQVASALFMRMIF